MLSGLWKSGKNILCRTRNSMCMDDLQISSDCQCQMKITFVGQETVGKTSFLITALKGQFPKVYVPSVCELSNLHLEVQGVQFQCALWDTASDYGHCERLRPLSYPDTNIFCICFSVVDPQSLEDVLDRFVPEVYHFKRPHDPVFLLGFQTDLRDDPATPSKLSEENKVPVTKEKAEETRRQIGAVAYIESSAIRRAHVLETFDTMLSLVLEASPKLRKRYSKQKERLEREEKIER